MIGRKDKILISAIELLDQEGVNGVTTKNLARLQGVTEPALYRQYKSKQDILINIVDEFALYDSKIKNTIDEGHLFGKEAIVYYVKRYAELFNNYAELTTVMFSMDLYQYHETTRQQMETIVKERLLFLERTILQSEELKQNKLSLSPQDFASLINGIVFSVVYEWRIFSKSFDLEERLMTMIDKIL
jgi:TetR/AcrR family transcriptional regulator, fatty acid metabolism regulator protein